MAGQKSIERKLEREGFIMIMGDVDLTYGQTWIRESDYDCFDIIAIVDLDSACGADGQILIEAKVTSYDFVRSGDTWRRIMSFVDTSSWLPQLARKDKAMARLALASAIADYGIADPAGYGASWFVAVFDRVYEKDAREKWGHRVPGWGYAAVQRAIENALACLDNGGMYLPHDITD